MASGRKRVLIVEDDPDTAEIVGFITETAGYRAVYAETVSVARVLLQNVGFCLILLDIMLPDGNGIELCRWIRTFDSRTPVLIRSATAISRREALAAGADDIIRKSSGDIDVLQDAVRSLAPRECPGK